MATVAECIEKLVVGGKVTRAVADKALALHKRMQTEFSLQAPPAGADAAAALAVARVLREQSAARERQIANKVKNYELLEQRVTQHPGGGYAGIMGAMVKDMWRGIKAFRDLPTDSPLKQGANVDELHNYLRGTMFNMFGAGLQAFKPGVLKDAAKMAGVSRMIDELFGVESGDPVAAAAAKAFKGTTDYAVDRAQKAGKIFEPNEDWRLPQPWTSSRVQKFGYDEFKRDFLARVDSGGLKFFDKDTGRIATAADYEKVLKRAYSDIITESSNLTPFSQQMRTFQFQPGQAGADAYKALQGKYGVGDNVLGMMAGHIDHMSRTIALQEVGLDPGNFAALMRLARERPGIPVQPGAERLNPVRLMAPFLQSENMVRATFDTITGKTGAVQSETLAHLMGGARNLIGASGLRNLPISIIPGDALMTLFASNHMGMNGFRILGEIFDGKISKEAAAHLQINAHGAADYISNSIRQYEDELSYSNAASWVARNVIKATGAEWWTTGGRRSAMTSIINQIAEHTGYNWEQLGNVNPTMRRFLDNYGFDAAQWDKMRAVPTQEIGGAKYYLNPENIEPEMYQRLLMGVHEQSTYMMHQPDARTRAFFTRGTQPGTAQGEIMRGMGQFKQFAVERMTTHLMRVLTDGTAGQRVGRGLAFTLLSMGAGAISLQAAAAVAGKKPLDMLDPRFWLQAFTKGGAGGIFGDVLASALEGGRSRLDIAGQLAGPLPGLGADIIGLIGAPIRAELDDNGKPKKSSIGGEAVGIGRRFTPNTWYTKLAVDRLLWDKAQTLVDPQYRSSFRRAEERANKRGSGFWWSPGESSPSP